LIYNNLLKIPFYFIMHYGFYNNKPAEPFFSLRRAAIFTQTDISGDEWAEGNIFLGNVPVGRYICIMKSALHYKAYEGDYYCIEFYFDEKGRSQAGDYMTESLTS